MSVGSSDFRLSSGFSAFLGVAVAVADVVDNTLGVAAAVDDMTDSSRILSVRLLSLFSPKM